MTRSLTFYVVRSNVRYDKSSDYRYVTAVIDRLNVSSNLLSLFFSLLSFS